MTYTTYTTGIYAALYNWLRALYSFLGIAMDENKNYETTARTTRVGPRSQSAACLRKVSHLMVGERYMMDHQLFGRAMSILMRDHCPPQMETVHQSGSDLEFVLF